MKTVVQPMLESLKGDGGVIRHKTNGRAMEWQRESCPDCHGGGASCNGHGKYGDSMNAQHVSVFGTCRTCDGCGEIMRADIYEPGEFPDTANAESEVSE